MTDSFNADPMPAPPASPSITPETYAETAAAIEREVGRAIVGQQDVVRTVLLALLCEGHVLLEGVPGLGKTKLLKSLADVIAVEFGRIQFTPDLMPADVLGTQVLEQDESGRRSFQFREGPIFAGLVLADEINRATPKTQSALLEAMQERAVTVAGATRPLPSPFLVMATQNPIEQEGTYPLPEAQLDRFLFKARVPFPNGDDLFEIMQRTTGTHEEQLSTVATIGELQEMIALTRSVPAADHVARHAVDLVVATHPTAESAPPDVQKYVRVGASPRGGQALLLGAKAAALLAGRPSASIADVRSMVERALAHRLVVGYEAIADGVDEVAIARQVLDHVPAPDSGVRGAP